MNPRTGPFFVDGAEPGDPLAIHVVSIESSRDWAASCTVPLFGALTTTTRKTLLHDPLPEQGALFSIGDGHCRQGEGETCGVAVEAAMDTVIAIDLVKGRTTPWPRLESDTHVMSTGSARSLEDAFRIAHTDLVAWMGDDYGLEGLDAYQLLTRSASRQWPTSSTPTARSWPG